MLQKPLESLYYFADFYNDLANYYAVLYHRVKKKPPTWTTANT